MTAQALSMEDRALHHPLKGSGRSGLAAVIGHQCFQLVVDVAGELLFERTKIDLAELHHTRSIHVLRQGKQEMLQCRVLVLSVRGVAKSPAQRRLKLSGELGGYIALGGRRRRLLAASRRLSADRGG